MKFLSADLLVWMRVPGDTIFSIGAVALTWFVLWLWIKLRPEQGGPPPQ